jgi:hypothetical protein
MDKDDLKKLASTDNKGDKRKQELLEEKLKGMNSITFGMECPPDKISKPISEEEILEFRKIIEEIRRMKGHEKE